ncbi:MAG: hypothetical protein KGD65_15305 [Candidatus Lokiarchaeota archaeon]|nr:hypothetical protein [Candidatus Lokiarchaeota archaeon]
MVLAEKIDAYNKISLDGKEAEIEAIFIVYSKAIVVKLDPAISAFVLSDILIVIPSVIFGVSYRYEHKKKLFLLLKNFKTLKK